MEKLKKKDSRAFQFFPGEISSSTIGEKGACLRSSNSSLMKDDPRTPQIGHMSLVHFTSKPSFLLIELMMMSRFILNQLRPSSDLKLKETPANRANRSSFLFFSFPEFGVLANDWQCHQCFEWSWKRLDALLRPRVSSSHMSHSHMRP